MDELYPHDQIEDMEEWEPTINAHDYLLVDFFATWCGPCKKLDNEIKKAVDKYPNLKVVKVDIDEADELCDEFEVENLPTVYYYHKGVKKSLFMGSRYPLFHKKVEELMANE